MSTIVTLNTQDDQKSSQLELVDAQPQTFDIDLSTKLSNFTQFTKSVKDETRQHRQSRLQSLGHKINNQVVANTKLVQQLCEQGKQAIEVASNIDDTGNIIAVETPVVKAYENHLCVKFLAMAFAKIGIDTSRNKGFLHYVQHRNEKCWSLSLRLFLFWIREIVSKNQGSHDSLTRSAIKDLKIESLNKKLGSLASNATLTELMTLRLNFPLYCTSKEETWYRDNMNMEEHYLFKKSTNGKKKNESKSTKKTTNTSKSGTNKKGKSKADAKSRKNASLTSSQCEVLLLSDHVASLLIGEYQKNQELLPAPFTIKFLPYFKTENKSGNSRINARLDAYTIANFEYTKESLSECEASPREFFDFELPREALTSNGRIFLQLNESKVFQKLNLDTKTPIDDGHWTFEWKHIDKPFVSFFGCIGRHLPQCDEFVIKHFWESLQDTTRFKLMLSKFPTLATLKEQHSVLEDAKSWYDATSDTSEADLAEQLAQLYHDTEDTVAPPVNSKVTKDTVLQETTTKGKVQRKRKKASTTSKSTKAAKKKKSTNSRKTSSKARKPTKSKKATTTKNTRRKKKKKAESSSDGESEPEVMTDEMNIDFNQQETIVDSKLSLVEQPPPVNPFVASIQPQVFLQEPTPTLVNPSSSLVGGISTSSSSASKESSASSAPKESSVPKEDEYSQEEKQIAEELLHGDNVRTPAVMTLFGTENNITLSQNGQTSYTVTQTDGSKGQGGIYQPFNWFSHQEE
jgi:hypothetical protein